jgi:hypothetical protein
VLPYRQRSDVRDSAIDGDQMKLSRCALYIHQPVVPLTQQLVGPDTLGIQYQQNPSISAFVLFSRSIFDWLLYCSAS